MRLKYRDGTMELLIGVVCHCDGRWLIFTDEIGTCARRRLADVAEIDAC